MPISQSASERQMAAAARSAISSAGRSLEKASRMAEGVIDCSQSRLVGRAIFLSCPR